MGSIRSLARVFGMLALAALALAGCQDMFTWSPVSALARTPDSLSPEQQVSFGRDALASGDEADMQAAYDALKDRTDDPEAQYVAAQLGIELSGIPDLFMSIVEDPASMTTALDDIDGFIAANGLSPELLIEAAAELQNAQALGTDLGPMDYVMGAMGLALEAAGPPYDLTGGADFTEALDFLAPAVTEVGSLPDGDPLKELIEGCSSYLES
jgi:hypothetical protein